MVRRAKHPEPFFMLFPWLRAAGLGCLLGFVTIFIFRLSETGGNESCTACIAAMVTVALGGLGSLYPLGKAWRRGVLFAFTAIMLGFSIRLLIGGAGIAIITFFTQVNKTWYILYVVVYYVLFLLVDSAFALWMLNYCEQNDGKEQRVHGNLWDMVS